jgi:sugar phosphate isomerase/epimerase
MARSIYLSLSACGGISTRQALASITAAGIKQVELAIGVKPDLDAARAVAEYQAAGIDFRAHHAFVWEAFHRPFDLSRSLDRDYFERAIEWLAQISVTSYSVHPGSYTDRPELVWESFLANLDWLSELCRSYGIEFGVETMYPICDRGYHYFLGDLESITKLKQMMPNLKWVLDLSHLNMWQQGRLEAIDLLRNDLLEIHISDNDGRRDLHTAIGNRTWWLPYLERLPISVPYIIETRLPRGASPQTIADEYQRICQLLS